jgi:hypothetical protein
MSVPFSPDPLSLLPEDCLTRGLAAGGGWAEGCREAWEGLGWSGSWRRPRSVGVGSCCCQRAWLSSRGRPPGPEDASRPVFEGSKQQAAAPRRKPDERLPGPKLCHQA